MKTRKEQSMRMDNEQVANYARKLMESISPIEAALGSMIWDAIYVPRDRASAAIRCVNGQRGKSTKQDAAIDQIIAWIKGESTEPYSGNVEGA